MRSRISVCLLACVSLVWTACPDQGTSNTNTGLVPDVANPDGNTGDAVAGDTPTGDALSDTQVGDGPTVDSTSPDTPILDGTTTDGTTTDGTTTDGTTTDGTTGDGMTGDGTTGDGTTGDGTAGDSSTTDGVVSDGSSGDVVTSDVVLTCEGDNPEGCKNTGCLSGQTCAVVPTECNPSTCTCDTTTGEWSCTKDCGGGTCLAPSGGSCTTDADCQFGAQWCILGTCQECDNSSSLCDIDCVEAGPALGTGYGLESRNGCTPCQCVLTNACMSDSDCDGDGLNTCVAGPICLPWCNFDDPSCCYGNTCKPGPCPLTTANPQACIDTGCAPGLSCEASPLAVCMSSNCFCDASNNDWACTDDCVSGVCVENVPN